MKFYRLRVEQPLQPLGMDCADPVACTIGNFDGVHLGHQSLVQQVLQVAKQHELKPAVMLFEPQPIEYLRVDQAPPRLMSWREKVMQLSALGIEVIFALQFNKPLSQLSPEAFVKQILVKACQARQVVVGDDFRFGRQRQGCVDDIIKFGQPNGLSVVQANTCLWQGARVSSTRVRAALAAGDLQSAEAMLGRSFEMAGKVVYGDQLGRTLGFPTANLKISQPSLPCRGVYAVSVSGAGLHCQDAVANLGVRPTLDGVRLRCEVHLMNFSGQLYGRHLRVRFLKKLRDEQRFDSAQALKTAISNDIETAKHFFKARV